MIFIDPTKYEYKPGPLSKFENVYEYDPRKRKNGMHIYHLTGVHMDHRNGVHMERRKRMHMNLVDWYRWIPCMINHME